MTASDATGETTALWVRASARGSVAVRGELDLATAPLLSSCVTAQLADNRCRSLSLDLAGVDFIDCSGLGALLSARAHAVELGKELVIDRAGPRVRQLLERTGTSRVLLRQ